MATKYFVVRFLMRNKKQFEDEASVFKQKILKKIKKKSSLNTQ